MSTRCHRSGWLFALVLWAVAMPVSAQSDLDTEPDASWRQYEGVVLASVTAACYALRHQSTWSADSLRYPDRFELTAREFTGLGYHRLGTFETDMAALVEDGLPPVWHPESLDAAFIDPDPAPVGPPNYQAYLERTSDEGDVVLETYWLDDNPLPGSDATRGRLIGRAYGTVVACEGAGESGGALRR